MVRKGDTLIEVTLAVGIFSMIAIAIVSVMSSGISGSQTALETTLTREEIDTQAEALRFIQSSHIANKTAVDNPYSLLWSQIKQRAIKIDDSNSDEYKSLLQYRPTSCDALYEEAGEVFAYDAFIINPRALGNFDKDTIDKVFISASPTDDVKAFTPASIYPRLLFGESDDENSAAEALTDSAFDDALYRAEGIYVIAVQDADSTTVIDPLDLNTNRISAFYDFYIRTCWYGSDATTPSTISTVIRLYDPDAAGY